MGHLCVFEGVELSMRVKHIALEWQLLYVFGIEGRYFGKIEAGNNNYVFEVCFAADLL